MATGGWGGALNQRVFRVTVSFRHAQQNCQTGFHLRDVGINTLSPEDVAEAVEPWVTTQFVKTLHTQDRVTGIDVLNLVTAEGHAISPSNLAGTQPGTECPAFITAVIALKGSLRKRYGQGRMLWPVPNTASFTQNQLVDATVAMYTTVLSDLMDRFVGSSLTTNAHLVNLHGEIPASQNTPVRPPQWYDVTNFRVNTVLSSLRRRKAGIGS